MFEQFVCMFECTSVSMRVCLCVCLNMFAYVYAYVCMCMCGWKYICAFVYLLAWMYVCVYKCIGSIGCVCIWVKQLIASTFSKAFVATREYTVMSGCAILWAHVYMHVHSLCPGFPGISTRRLCPDHQERGFVYILTLQLPILVLQLSSSKHCTAQFLFLPCYLYRVTSRLVFSKGPISHTRRSDGWGASRMCIHIRC